MWMTRMSTASPTLSLDHSETVPASPLGLVRPGDEEGAGCAAQQATITHGSTPPIIQEGDDSSAGEP
jgi:hypothetical protein